MNKKVVYIASGAMIIISIVIVVLLIRMRNKQSVVDDDKLRDEIICHTASPLTDYDELREIIIEVLGRSNYNIINP